LLVNGLEQYLGFQERPEETQLVPMVGPPPSLFVGSLNEQGGTANSSSGYNTAARQARDKRGSQNPIEWSRQADYEFTGCLAHADVTSNRGSGQTERIIGYFEHSEKCQAAAVIRSALGET